MSWAIHWQVPFAGFDGGQYRVNILEQDYAGSVVTLTGGAQPFMTEEDSDDDVFIPLRGQSGYLRVVTDDQSLMESMIPGTNTEKLVELRYGSGDVLMWRGFLQSQAFSQPWDNNLRQLEFPVKSVLAALEDVEMEQSMSAERGQLWPILVAAMDALGVAPMQLVIATSESSIGSMFGHYVKYKLFFVEEDVDNDGTTSVEQISNSYYDVLSSIATLHGVVIREQGTTLYIMDYISEPTATAGTLKVATFTWSNIAAGTYVATTTTEMSSADLATVINNTKRGRDNVIGYIKGRKAVRMQVELNQDGEALINLPNTTEDTTTVQQKSVNGDEGTVYMQVHEPRVNSLESYYFSEYSTAGVRQGASTYALCLANSPINSAMDTFPAYTGAYPCRWFYKEGTDQVILVNGMYMTLINGRQSTTDYSETGRCYTLASRYAQRLTGGYLNINLTMHYFTPTLFDHADTWTTKLCLVAKFGDYSWDGSAWQPSSAGTKMFTVDIKNGTIVTNKTDDMNVDGDTGYFIPVGEEKYGTLELYVMDYYQGFVYMTIAPVGFIFESLTMDYYYPSDLSVSQRTTNNYYRSLLRSGFGSERTITTNIGTWNNNLPSLSFLYDANAAYIETMTYLNGGAELTQRPELHLLTNMAAYFATIRRTMTQVMKLAEIYDRIYSYGGKYFMAIDELHDWRDDKQRVKFIEVK